MHRRDLIAAGTLLAVTAAATAASAGGPTSDAPAEGASLNIAGLGLPLIVDGRLRNYVFVSIKLHLGDGHTAESLRGKEPYFRDALVRTAHRAPFTMPGDMTRLHEPAINAAMVAIAGVVAGKGSVARSEVTLQAPRRRSGLPTG